MPTYRDRPATLAVDVVGVDAGGRPYRVPVLETGRWTLLLFLSTTCDGCQPLWDALGDPVGCGLATDELVVTVTRDPSEEDPLAVRRVAPAVASVVMSTAAWSAYRVQGPPFFALVDGTPGAAPGGGGSTRPGVLAPVRVATEGVAWSVGQVAADVRRARARREGGS